MVLEKRLRLRGTDPESSIVKRLEKAASELSFAGKFDQVIINDDLERASGEAISLVRQFLEND
jgi:guanylate kinase